MLILLPISEIPFSYEVVDLSYPATNTFSDNLIVSFPVSLCMSYYEEFTFLHVKTLEHVYMYMYTYVCVFVYERECVSVIL